MIDALNGFAGRWWSWVAPMAWQVALLALVVWLADLALRRRGWPQVRYALWTVVLLKLLIPPTFALPTSIFSQALAIRGHEVAPAAVPVQAPLASSSGPAPSDPAVPEAQAAPAPVRVPARTAVGSEVADAALQDLVPAESAILSVQAWAMLGSGAVSVALLAWLVVRAVRLRRMVRAAAAGRAPDGVTSALADCSCRLGLARIPRLVVTDAVRGPAVFGVWRPVLLLPRAMCEAVPTAQMGHIMLHELAHVKRGDLFVNAVQTLAHVAFWFHPAVWLAGSRMRHLRELCCDASVSRLLGEGTREYRETLAGAVRGMVFGATAAGLGLLGLFESASNVRQRLEHLEKPSWKHARLKALTSLAAIAVMVGCIVPMGKVEQAQAPADAPTAGAGQDRSTLVLLDESWAPDLAQNDTVVTEISTEASGDPTQAVAGYFSVRLENETGAPSARFRSANSGLYKDLPPDRTEARLWYRTDRWDGKLALQLWALVPGQPAPVLWLEAELDGGGPDGRLVADDRWRQAKGLLKKGADFDRVLMDDVYRTCLVWLKPVEGPDIRHTTYVDLVEAVPPGKAQPTVTSAQRVGPAPGAQNDGPGWVWWEAEDAANAVPEPTNTLLPRNADAQKSLSNGTWIQGADDGQRFPYAAPEDAEPFRYEVKVADDGTYALWLRGYCARSSFRWRWDGGEWHASAPGTDSIGAVMLTGNWVPVGWSRLGEVALTAGTHTFEVQTVQMPNRTALAFDCYVLAKGAFVPPAAVPRPAGTS
jgi:beta-lactamase regulating signal transducer with metallopeptidase domain